MPGIVTNGVHDDGEVNEMNGNRSPTKASLTPIKSPRSSMSPQRRQSVGPNFQDDGVVEPSIEQLYENVCDMQSSDQSPSRQSFGSDGDESRIDSELHHLVGGRMRELEIMEEEVEVEVGRRPGESSSGETSSGMGNLSDDKKLDMVAEIQSGSNSPVIEIQSGSKSPVVKTRSSSKSPVSSEKIVKPLNSRLGSDTSPRSKPKGKSPPAKAPLERKNDQPLRKQTRGVNGVKNSPLGKSVSMSRVENSAESALDKPERAPILLKQARDLMSTGDNPHKALELALQAMKLFEKFGNGKPSLELVMCLHVTAAIYCSLGRYSEAIPILERSIEIPDIGESQQHALAKFAGHMQLGDTYAMLGQLENSIMFYTAGFEVQRHILGETDPRVGETCRYLAEANVQALQFNEAEELCQMALDIHRENSSAPSIEEAADRRLMGLICETKGNHEAALEHLVLASMAMVANGQEAEVASVDCSIGAHTHPFNFNLRYFNYFPNLFLTLDISMATKASKPSHPTYEEMIKDAIVTLKERTGSSQFAIAKFIEEKHKQLPSNFKKLLLHNLKKNVASGKLIKVKGSFKLSPATKPSAEKKPAAAKPKTKAVAKVTAVKAKPGPKPKAKAVVKTKVAAKAKPAAAKPKPAAAKPKAPAAKPKAAAAKAKPAAKAKTVVKPAKASRTSTRTTPGKKVVAAKKPAVKKAVAAKKAPVKKAVAAKKSPAKKVVSTKRGGRK